MDFNYEGYTEDRRRIKGTIAALNEGIAAQTLAHNGYRVLSLKPVSAFMPNWEEAFPSFFRIKPETIIMFSRQLALLLESGIDIVTALELLKEQASNRRLKKVLDDVVSDLRGGNRLSVAISKYPRIFPKMYVQSLNVGEQSGSLELVLKRIADYMERELGAVKDVKNALKYPIIVAIVALIVISVIVTFVLPAFADLYSSLGAELPLMLTLLLSSVEWLIANGIYVIVIVLLGFFLAYTYIKSPQGGLKWDTLMLRLPMLGRVSHLSELGRCCRSMALLFQAGLPLPEIMSLVVDSCSNRMVRKGLIDVQQEMLKGEGLSVPMSKRPIFLPMMVQMIHVGEETGNLDVTLQSVAQSFENEAEDKMRSFVGLIQPTITMAIGVAVAVIALTLVSAMYSIYGQV
ncbi:type II secretion system F family protein [Chloroflexota bacterium]